MPRTKDEEIKAVADELAELTATLRANVDALSRLITEPPHPDQRINVIPEVPSP